MKERYHRNCQIVYDIYGIPKKERGTVYNIHHQIFRHDLGDLVPITFDIDNISNLYPLRRDVHEKLHLKVERDEIEHPVPKRHKHKR
jgi:hypothetical protein